MFDLPPPSPAKVEAHKLLSNENNIEHRSMSAMGDVPTGESRIDVRAVSSEARDEIIKLLQEHSPEDGYRVEEKGGYIHADARAFAVAHATVVLHTELESALSEGKPKQDARNRGAEHQSRPSAGRICRVAAGLATWTPEEKAYLKDHLDVIAFHDQLQAALQEVHEERGGKSNLQTRIDDAKNKTPENDDDRDRGPSRGGR